jgi:hypothetical protein
LDAARNLSNIGTISSGAINATGNVTASNLISGNITVGANAINNSSSRLYLQYYTPANGVDFMNNKVFFNSSGNATFAGTINSGAITSSGNVTLSSTAPLLYLTNTTSGTGKAWRFSSASNGKLFITQEGVIDAVTLDHTTGNATFAGTISSGAISLNGDLTVNNPTNNYVRIESTGSFEQMIRFKNGLANYWYTGLRTSNGIASTADYHIYSTALSNDAMAVTTGGNIIANKGFFSADGDSTPAGTAFSNVFKGTNSNYRTVYFDGHNLMCSVWWGVGNNPHAALDSADGQLATYTNDSVGTWRKITEHNSSGLNITTGGLLVGSTTVIDSSRNLVNIAEATLTGDINLAYGTNLWIGNQADSGNRGRFHATGGSLYIDWGTTGNLNFRSGSTTSTVRGYITNTGDYVASGNVTAYSDKRLKTNIQTLDGKKALKMRGVSFIKDGVEGSGVIAQEIEEIAPELVMTADDEMGTKSVAYGNLVGYLIEAIKEQQQQIDELKARLDNDSSK